MHRQVCVCVWLCVSEWEREREEWKGEIIKMPKDFFCSQTKKITFFFSRKLHQHSVLHMVCMYNTHTWCVTHCFMWIQLHFLVYSWSSVHGAESHTGERDSEVSFNKCYLLRLCCNRTVRAHLSSPRQPARIYSFIQLIFCSQYRWTNVTGSSCSWFVEYWLCFILKGWESFLFIKSSCCHARLWLSLLSAPLWVWKAKSFECWS